MNRSMKALIALGTLTASFFFATASQPSIAQEASEEASEKADTVKLYPEVSDEVWNKARKAFENSPFLALSTKLDLNRARNILDSISEQTGIRYRMEEGSVFEMLRDEGAFDHQSGVHYSLDFANQLEDEQVKDGQFIVTVESEDGDEYQRYIVPVDKMEGMDRKVLRQINLIHPLNRTIPTLSVQDGNLAALCADLCDIAGVDYSIDQSIESPGLSLKLSNRSVHECLTLATQTTGWEWKWSRRGRTYRYHDTAIDAESLRYTWVNRKLSNLTEGSDIEDIHDALHWLATREARELAQSRAVVQVRARRSAAVTAPSLK